MAEITYPWARMLNRPIPQADFEVISTFSVEECHYILTGKKRPGRLGDKFVKRLGLDGRMALDFISVRLPDSMVSGDIEKCSGGTRVRLWSSKSRVSSKPVAELTILAVVAAIPFVVYSLVNGNGIPAFLLLPVVFLASQWLKEYRRRLPAYPNDVEDLAQMLAGHIRGRAMSSDRASDSQNP